MPFFRQDLWRSFIVGFALSAIAMLGALGPDGRSAMIGDLVPQAIAKTAPAR